MAVINATEATFTASRNIENGIEFLIFFTIRFNNATNKNAGKNIPIVDTIAPKTPYNWYPIIVTDGKTGPGVNCPTAMACIKVAGDNKPFATSSASSQYELWVRQNLLSPILKIM